MKKMAHSVTSSSLSTVSSFDNIHDWEADSYESCRTPFFSNASSDDEEEWDINEQNQPNQKKEILQKKENPLSFSPFNIGCKSTNPTSIHNSSLITSPLLNRVKMEKNKSDHSSSLWNFFYSIPGKIYTIFSDYSEAFILGAAILMSATITILVAQSCPISLFFLS